MQTHTIHRKSLLRMVSSRQRRKKFNTRIESGRTVACRLAIDALGQQCVSAARSGSGWVCLVMCERAAIPSGSSLPDLRGAATPRRYIGLR
jgi:hypothetical protein